MNLQRYEYESGANNVSKASPRGRLSSGEPNPVDVHVGRRVRLRRFLLGMSQEKLGSALGLTFQQVQKYERGANRIGASRLWDLSLVLKCPVSYFYEDMTDQVSGSSPRNLNRTTPDVPAPEAEEDTEEDMIVNRETMDLVRTFSLIKDEKVRRRISDLTKALVHSEVGESEQH